MISYQQDLKQKIDSTNQRIIAFNLDIERCQEEIKEPNRDHLHSSLYVRLRGLKASVKMNEKHLEKLKKQVF